MKILKDSCNPRLKSVVFDRWFDMSTDSRLMAVAINFFPPIKFWQCQKISDTFLQCDISYDNRQTKNQLGALNLMTQLARQLQTTKMSKRVWWTVQQEEKLIELWREKECLYDVSSQLYHDRVKKEAVWREIGCYTRITKLPQVRAVELEVHKVLFCPAMTCSTHVFFVFSFYYQGM